MWLQWEKIGDVSEVMEPSLAQLFYLMSPADLLVFRQESAAVNSPPPPPPPGSVSSPLPVQSTQRSQNLQDSSGDSPVQPVLLPERHLEAVEVLRDLSRLRERFRRLGPRVAALEEGRVEERAQRSRLQELVSSRGNVVQPGLNSFTSGPSMDWFSKLNLILSVQGHRRRRAT